ncbi:WXG100 family type VII secretion target [Mycobacterium camsae]|uniref:WXG100 family type VII secretion target n=1 Tax=Mycobacterium gordonae TaxID=1778 RepID=UPI00197F3B93|nr:WXG100 family type VII secretion target [Mycobacterium gordonae]
MTTQHWNFAGIEVGASEILGYFQMAQGLLEDGKKSLTNLAAAWGGTGSESYQTVQQRWDNTANELNSSLQSLARAISESGQAMAQTESAVSAMFT